MAVATTFLIRQAPTAFLIWQVRRVCYDVLKLVQDFHHSNRMLLRACRQARAPPPGTPIIPGDAAPDLTAWTPACPLSRVSLQVARMPLTPNLDPPGPLPRLSPQVASMPLVSLKKKTVYLQQQFEAEQHAHHENVRSRFQVAPA